MNDRLSPANTGFFFDDEPLDSILYDGPVSGTGPTPAGLFASAEPFVFAILNAFERGDVDEGLKVMAELLARGYPVSMSNLTRFSELVGAFIPNIPCPIVLDRGVPYDFLLEHLLAAGLECDEEYLVHGAGTTLYRFFEGAGRYGDAIRVVVALLERAKRKGNPANEAVLTNNLGYDHLLARDWDRAEEFFARAIILFGDEYALIDRVNARLNHLLARFERAGGDPPERFERKLHRFLTALGNDWRRRKALVPLARIAERRGDLEMAIRFARQAVESAEGVPTRHLIEDHEYLSRLRCKSEGTP